MLGSVLVAVLDYARVAGRHPTQSASAKRPPGTSVSTQTTGTIGPSACRFAGVISFQYPGFGNTLSTGHDVYGNVTAWSAGCRVMLFVRPEASSTETRQPRCQVAGTTWTCPNVQLLGAAGTREYLDVLVLDAAASPPDQSAALPHGALAQDDTQAYKA